MESVECSGDVGSVDVVVWGPGVVTYIVAFPLDEVLESPITEATIQDSFNLELLMAVYQCHGRWRCRATTSDRIGGSERQFDDREKRGGVGEGLEGGEVDKKQDQSFSRLRMDPSDDVRVFATVV